MKKWSKSLFLLLVSCLVMLNLTLVCSAVAQADGGNNNPTDKSTSAAEGILTEGVEGGKISTSSDILSNTYKLDGGGSLAYGDIVIDGGIVGSNFNLLTSSAKQDLLLDMIACADYAVENNDIVDESTKTTWLQDLQSCDGVGTQLMTTLLENVKPDFVGANRIFEPMNGIVGTALGLGAIVIMACLSLVVVLELCYIGIAPLRALMQGDSSEKPKYISYIAHDAITKAETSGDSKTSKEALGIYFKSRVKMMLVLGICLLYLVSGKIFALIGMFLDLLEGFIGV